MLLITEPALHLLVCRDDGRVVAVAEVTANLGVGCASVLAGQVHGQHPGIGQGTGAAVRAQGLGIDLEKLADRTFDVAQANSLDGVPDRVAQGGPGERHVQALAGKQGVGNHTVDCPFQLAHAGAQMLGNVIENSVGNRHTPSHGSCLEDRTPGCQVGAFELDDHAAEEPCHQLLHQPRDPPRVLVGRQDDRSPAGDQRVERV